MGVIIGTLFERVNQRRGLQSTPGDLRRPPPRISLGLASESGNI